jgi:hypothetical protein
MKGCDDFEICLDGSYLSGLSTRNQDTVNYLSRIISKNGFAGYPHENAPFSMIHNKGFVIDHRLSWVSSINWNMESNCANREIGLLINSEAIARFFEYCIETDIHGDIDPPVITPKICYSEEDASPMLQISPDSDSSGLKKVILVLSDGTRFKWSMPISLEWRNKPVGIELTDLWGNQANCTVLLFPDREHAISSPISQIAGISPGIVLSFASSIGLILISARTIKRALLQSTRLTRFWYRIRTRFE